VPQLAEKYRTQKIAKKSPSGHHRTICRTEAAQIADRWKWYYGDLYHNEEGNGTEQEYWEQELRSEVARAIRQTASRKATGLDDVPAELFKAGETALDRIRSICMVI